MYIYTLIKKIKTTVWNHSCEKQTEIALGYSEMFYTMVNNRWLNAAFQVRGCVDEWVAIDIQGYP